MRPTEIENGNLGGNILSPGSSQISLANIVGLFVGGMIASAAIHVTAHFIRFRTGHGVSLDRADPLIPGK
jgi:hypothetical protein